MHFKPHHWFIWVLGCAHRQSSPAHVKVDGGTYPLGCSDRQDKQACKGVGSANVSEFWIDRTEVLFEQYELCVAQARCQPIGRGPERAHRLRDIALVTYQDAATYCGFVSGRLPTADEWEIAARGKRGWLYPWGNEWNRDNIAMPRTLWLSRDNAYTYFTPCESPARSPFGLCDMAGTAPEFVASDGERAEVRGAPTTRGDVTPSSYLATRAGHVEPGTRAAFRCVYAP